MALEFLNDTPQRAFRKLERDLMLVNPEVKMGQYKAMTPRSLDNVLESLDGQRATMLAENTYGTWLASEEYVEIQLMKEAVTFLVRVKESLEDPQRLVLDI